MLCDRKGPIIKPTQLWVLLITVLSLLVLVGCEQEGRKRPFGYLKIGAAKEYLKPETYLPEMRLLVRYDEATGFSVMSTMCTHDLSPLTLTRNSTGEEIFVSQYSESKYRKDGSVLNGPAMSPLPFYKVELKEGSYGGPADTLYVAVGSEVPASWRLPVR